MRQVVITQKWVTWIVLVLLAFSMCSFSRADSELPSAPAGDQIVRVHLSRLGITDRMDITLISPYVLTTENGDQLLFHAGSELAFLMKEGRIYLHYENMSMGLGRSLSLLRTAPDDKGESGFRLTNYPALYMGDLLLDVDQEKLRPVLSIHVEDYLLGVIPYEMGDSFPLEALKAQAVAARTYALRKQNSQAAYDVVDTTNDQVFKGYQPGSPVSEQAVRETRGVCGFYKGKLAQCYYSASNGGQMELVESVWPVEEDFGYYTFGQDSYDIENPLSVVRSLELPKNGGTNTPPALKKLLADALHDTLVQRGFDPALESLRVDSVLAASVEAPVSENSLLMTALRLTVEISARTRHEAVEIVDADAEEVSLFATEAPSVTPSAFVPIVTAQPTSSPRPVYGPFVAFEDPVTVVVPIFPTAEAAFGMNISSHYDNEIWSVRETEGAFVVEARRYGHGVGMSQRGAQWMAAVHDKTYQDILGFYYPGMTLMQYPVQAVRYAKPETALEESAGPAPTPTPRPTLMPATIEAEEGQWYAFVTEISDDSSLNLREEPGLTGNILMRLYKHQKLLVLERCKEEGWVKVRTDVVEGYVMESYLTAAE